MRGVVKETGWSGRNRLGACESRGPGRRGKAWGGAGPGRGVVRRAGNWGRVRGRGGASGTRVLVGRRLLARRLVARLGLLLAEAARS